jgi:hypothetical protein
MTRRARDSDYLLLGVSPRATRPELLSAYRRRARELHPDVRPDDPQADDRFRDLDEAYRAVDHAAAAPPRPRPAVRLVTRGPRAEPEPLIRATPTVVRPWPGGG